MTDIAAAFLRDVPLHDSHHEHGGWMYRAEVLAALSRALDPSHDNETSALTERAGEVLSRLRKADEYEPLGHDGWEAADLITALLAQIAALRAERDRYLRHLTAGAESLNAYKAHAASAIEHARASQFAAEAKVEKLLSAVKGLVEVLDQHETKGPLPDTALMFCWLAAQNVRAVLRGYMLEKPE